MAELRVRRDDLAECEVVEGESLRRDHAGGEAQLLVERFALSANNVTYAVLGDELGYWRVFPAPEGWGHIPAWGYARAVASRSPALAEGQRVFGLVPMATYFSVRPAPHRLGFEDASPHRTGLAPMYNRYMWTNEGADAELIMRPLFGTSILLDLTLDEASLHGASTVVLTSASAKTAYGLAYLLRERPVATMGLTSPARRAWVEGLGLYDRVLAYDEIDELDPSGDLVLVDFAGDRPLLHELHERLGHALVRSISVGFTHRMAGADESPLPDPPPEFFFAPDEMKGRGREVAQRYLETWQGFAPVLERTLQIERITDADKLVRVYRDLVNGNVDPSRGYVSLYP
jgi:hypothetical protein